MTVLGSSIHALRRTQARRIIGTVAAVRGLSLLVNDLPLGRNIHEALRLVDALQFSEEHGEVCPANWNKGKEGMKPSPQGVASYLAKNAGKL